jgi:hypothetical protein
MQRLILKKLEELYARSYENAELYGVRTVDLSRKVAKEYRKAGETCYFEGYNFKGRRHFMKSGFAESYSRSLRRLESRGLILLDKEQISGGKVRVYRIYLNDNLAEYPRRG